MAATAELGIIIKLKDMASGKMADFGRKVGFAMSGVSAAMTAVLVDATKTAARTEVLGTVLEVVGKNAGHTAAELDNLTDAIKAKGITTQVANQTLTRMIQYNLDLAKSTDLARLAQDAAVISGQNSSQALESIIHGITTMNVRVLRTQGIMVDTSNAFNTFARQVGKTVEQLTAGELQQAMFNAVMEQGKAIAGSYEAAMDDAGKKLSSFPRYIEEAKNALGVHLLPVMGAVIDAAGNLVKWFTNLSDSTQKIIAFAGAATAGLLGLAGAALMLAPAIVALAAGGAALIAPYLAVAAALAVVSVGIAALIVKLQEKKQASIDAIDKAYDLGASWQEYQRIADELAVPASRRITEELYKQGQQAEVTGDQLLKLAVIQAKFEDWVKLMGQMGMENAKTADATAKLLTEVMILAEGYGTLKDEIVDMAVEHGVLNEVQADAIKMAWDADRAMLDLVTRYQEAQTATDNLADATRRLGGDLEGAGIVAVETAARGIKAWRDTQIAAEWSLKEIINLQEWATHETETLYSRHHIELMGLQIQAEQQRLSLTAIYEAEHTRLAAAGATDQLAILNKNYSNQMSQLKNFWGVKIANTKGLYAIERQNLVAQIKAKIQMRLMEQGLQIGINKDTAVAIYELHMASVSKLIKDSTSLWDAYLNKLAAAGIPADKIKALQDAINSAANDAVSAAERLSAQAQAEIDAMWTEFEAGESILDDITAGLGDLNDALGDTGSAARAAIDPLKAAANTISGLASMVDRATEAFQKLADYGIEMPDFEAGWNKLLPQIEKMVMGLADLLGDVPEDDAVFARLEAWAKRMKAAASIIKDALGALSALAKGTGGWVDPKDVERMGKNIRGVFWAFHSTLKGAHEWLDEDWVDKVAARMQHWAKRIKPFADAIKNALAPLRDLAKGIPAWIDPETVRQMGFNLRGIFWAFHSTLKGDMDQVLDPEYVDKSTARMKHWLSRIKPFADMLKSVLGVLRDLAEGVPKWAPPSGVKKLGQHLLSIFWAFHSALTGNMDEVLKADYIDKIAARMEHWADRIKPFASIIRYALDLMRDLAEGMPKSASASGVGKLAANLQAMFYAVAEALDSVVVDTEGIDALAEKLTRWAARLAPLASIVSDALSVLDTLSEEFSVNIAGDLEAVAEALEQMVLDFDRWLASIAFLEDGTDVMGQKLQAWATRIGAIADMLTKGLKALTEMKAWKIVTDVSDQMDAFKKAWGYIIEVFQALVKEVGWLLDDDVKKFALIMQDIADALLKATETLTAISEYVHPAEQAMTDFQEDYQTLFENFAQWAAFLPPYLQAEVVKPWAEALEAFYSGLGNAVTVLEAIIDYVSPGKEALTTFQDDYQGIFFNFIQWITFLPIYIKVEVIKPWTEALEAFYSGLGNAVEVLGDIVDYVSPGKEALDQFEADYQELFLGFGIWIGNLPIWMTANLVKPWAEALQAFYSGLGNAVTVLESLIDYISPGAEALGNFERDYQALLFNFGIWIGSLPLWVTANLVKPWAEALQALFAGLVDAVTVLTGLSDYVTPAGTALDDFKKDFLAIMQAFANWVGGLEAEIDVTVVGPWADAMASLFAGLKDAVIVLQGVGGLFHPSKQKLEFFMDQVEAIFTRMSGFAAGLGVDAIEITGKFGAALSELSGGLSSALSYMTRIEEMADVDLSEGGTFDRALSKFMDAIDLMMREFLGWINQNFDADTAALVTDLGNTVGDLVEGLSEALTFLSNLVGTELPSMDTLMGFCDLIIETFRKLVEGLQETAPLIGPAIEAIALAMSLSLLPAPEAWFAHGALYINNLVAGLNSGLPALGAAVRQINGLLSGIGQTGGLSMGLGGPASMNPGALAPAAAGTVVNQNFSLAGAQIRSDDDVRMLAQELYRDVRRTTGVRG